MWVEKKEVEPFRLAHVALAMWVRNDMWIENKEGFIIGLVR
jgi:hypothetical protein